jgi:glycogen synthase
MVSASNSRSPEYLPKVSVVICTDGRRDSLHEVLKALEFQDFSEFEVCIIIGPTPDGTAEMVAAWQVPTKVVRCSSRNLSLARNLGISVSAGEIVAFLDDDAIPEPEWLDELVAPYANPAVGAVGGYVLNHTGAEYQYRYATVNRLGVPDTSWQRAASELAFPYSYDVPHMLGANCSFRRTALSEIGGFDEEFEYYLDETDVQARVLDRGWNIVQLDRAHVHHKYRSSELRTHDKAIRSWYPLIKNKIYFCLKHARAYHSHSEVLSECERFVRERESTFWADVEAGKLSGHEYDRFKREVEAAWRVGLKRGSIGAIAPVGLKDGAESKQFLHYRTFGGDRGRGALCFVTQEYPPGRIGGVGRYIHALAEGAASQGEQVHVITRGEGHDRIDFENGVWVHRIAARAYREGPPDVPEAQWNHSLTVLSELDAIAARRKVESVYSPIWDYEGIAALRSGKYRLVVGLQTMLKSYAASNPELQKDAAFLETILRPGMRIESEMLVGADVVHAISSAIGRQAEADQQLDLSDRLRVVPIGLVDAANSNFHATRSDEKIVVLFVGRLEARKGLDALLEAIARVASVHRDIEFRLVGDEPAVRNQLPYTKSFEAKHPDFLRRGQVVFVGPVSDHELTREYEQCDIFVAPSRFESFGLVFVEAMMFGKPVIGTSVGGIPEVVKDGVTGILVPPDDPVSLEAAIVRLAKSTSTRLAMGKAGRERYEESFTTERMVSGVVRLMRASHHQSIKPEESIDA